VRVVAIRNVHNLKMWPKEYYAVLSGEKTHEVRRDDRTPPFVVGDLIRLNEWVPDDPDACRYDAKGLTGVYTGNSLLVRIQYITRGGEFGIPSDMCVMSICKESP